MHVQRGTVITLVVVAAFFLVAGVVILRSAENRSSLEASLSTAIRAAPDGDTLQLNEVTDFAWERLYLFGPYTTDGVINEALGFNWSGAADTGIGQSDGHNLLVFVDGQEVVDWAMLGRAVGDFPGHGEFTPAEAKFIVRRNASGAMTELAPSADSR